MTGEPAPAKRRISRWITFIPLAVLAIILGVALSRLTSSNPAPASFSSPMRPAPAFDLPGLDGERVAMAGFKGRPVLVNFWATWCGPCQVEHPVLVKMKEQGVEIVGILYKDPDIEKARIMLARNGNPYSHVALDPEGATGLDFGLTKLPENYLIDANGVIVKSLRTYFEPADPRQPDVLPPEAAEFVAAYKAEVEKAKGMAR